MAVVGIGVGVGGSLDSASAATATAIQQCDGLSNVGGQQVTCSVTVVNNLNVATGNGSSTVTTVVCVGAAKTAGTCTTDVQREQTIVTSVDQCNGSGNGGGGEVDTNA